MNKAEFVAAVAAKLGASKAEAGRAVDAVLDTIQDALAQGGDVRFPGFGSFAVAERAAREGKNPRTGETVRIAASKAPKFSAGKAFKESLNGA